MTLATKIKEVTDELVAKSKVLKGIFDEAGPEFDMDKVKSLSGDSQAKVGEIRKLNDEQTELGKKLDELKALEGAAERAKQWAADNGGEPPAGGERGGDGGGEEKGGKANKVTLKSIGQLFAESIAVKEFQGGDSKMVHLDFALKTLMTTTAGWAPESTRIGLRTDFPTRPAPQVVDYIPQVATAQAAIKYMEETTFTNAAAETTEGSAYQEATLALTERTRPVQKITVWLPVTDEQIEDVPGLMDYVNNRLIFMIMQRLDAQVLVGNGTPPNLLGTENVSGIQSQPLGGDPIPDAIYKLFTLIRSDGFAEPGPVFIHPTKWQTVRLLRTADGIYIWGNPSEAGPERIWGKDVIQTTGMTSTKVVTGDYAMHSSLFIRSGVDMQISNSHSTFFVEGKQAIRADMRAAMVHFRPKAFGVVTGL